MSLSLPVQDGRLLYLDYIKALAIFLVIVYHSNFVTNPLGLALLSMCVTLFFAVNGYVMLSKRRTLSYYINKNVKLLFLILFWGFLSDGLQYLLGGAQFSLYIVCLLLLIAMSFQVVENKTIKYLLLCVFQLLGIFAVFNIGCKAKNTKWCHYPAFFMEGSFFIFAFHQIRTVSDTERLLDILFCHSQNWIVLTTEYILTPVIVVAICLLVYKVLRRICPKVLYVLDGR